MWNLKPGWGSRPDIHVEGAHKDDITGLKFSVDGQILLSRSIDNTLKVLCLSISTFVIFPWYNYVKICNIWLLLWVGMGSSANETSP